MNLKLLSFLTGAFCICAVVTTHGENLLKNPGFESGKTTGWFPFGKISLTPEKLPHSGKWSMQVGAAKKEHAIAQSILGRLTSTNTYSCSAWVKLIDPNEHRVKLAIKKVDASGTNYFDIGDVRAKTDTWTLLGGSYTFQPTGTVTELVLFITGPSNCAFLIDDVTMQEFDWRKAANARIEQIRKRDARIRVVDANGKPLRGVKLEIRETRPQFAFGTCINGNIIHNPAYADFVRSNFEWVVFENESKWYSNEPARDQVTYAVADKMVDWCRSNHITMRGHCIFWEVEKFVQPWIKSLPPDELRVAMSNRLHSAVSHFHGTFVHWDVNNEMLHGFYFTNQLGPAIRPWMFKEARAVDPTVKLFVNDFNVVSGAETESYKKQINDLRAAGADINGIGVQCHFGPTVDPVATDMRLDSLSEEGLPIFVTEYDSINRNEEVRADNLEALYRTAFSKPAVQGILMWGFWANSHWRGPDAAIVNADWTLNAAGRRYQSLRQEWTTRTSGSTDRKGTFRFRGFHGDYVVKLSTGSGNETTHQIHLEPGQGAEEFTLAFL